MALTAEQEKFVVDLFTIYQKRQQINNFAIQRETDEKALAIQFDVVGMNIARAALVTDYKNNTAQLHSEIEALNKTIAK